MTGFTTTTPAGNTVHIRGNRLMDDTTLDKLNYMFDLAIAQAEREATYQAWLCFIDWLEPEPPRNHRLARHYYRVDDDGENELLITLDEFVRAVIDGDLA